MGTMASQITSLTIVYSTVYSGADQRKHQTSASLAFVWGIHRRPVNSPHKWPVTRKKVSIWWRHHVIYIAEVTDITAENKLKGYCGGCTVAILTTLQLSCSGCLDIDEIAEAQGFYCILVLVLFYVTIFEQPCQIQSFYVLGHDCMVVMTILEFVSTNPHVHFMCEISVHVTHWSSNLSAEYSHNTHANNSLDFFCKFKEV